MGSLLEPRYPPARTPSRTSHAFRSNQNTFSPYGSLAELNAAMSHQSFQPHQTNGTPHQRSPSNLPPPAEEVADLGESFYGEEIDYGNVTHQMHPDDSLDDGPYNHGPRGAYYHESQGPSRAGTGWGSRAGSFQQTPHQPGKVYSLHDDQFIPPLAEKRNDSRAGTSYGKESEHERARAHVPSIQIHSEDQKYMYPPVQNVRTKSSRATVHHVSDEDGSQIIRAKSSRAAVHHSGSDNDYDYDHDPRPPLARTRSSRASARRTPRNISSKGSRASARDMAFSASIPAHFTLDGDNVILEVHLPWTERLNDRPCRFHVTGVDGKNYHLEIDYQWTKMIQGTAKFRGAGLPRKGGYGRGTLIVDWDIWFEEKEEDFSD